MLELLLLLLGIIVILLGVLKTRETFVVKYGNPFDGEDILSFDPNAKGTRLFSTTPDTCPLDRPVLDAGLCYKECEEGYHGIATTCWANTKDIGPGIMADFRNCTAKYEEGGMGLDDAYIDIGLLCFKPLKCTSRCVSDKRDAFGRCWAWDLRISCEGPDVKPKGLKCPGRTFQLTMLTDILGEGLGKLSEALGGDSSFGSKLKTDVNNFPDLVDGLCYRKCPEDKPNHITGFGYLCTKGERGLSYDRGAGTVPPLFHFGP